MIKYHEVQKFIASDAFGGSVQVAAQLWARSIKADDKAVHPRVREVAKGILEREQPAIMKLMHFSRGCDKIYTDQDYESWTNEDYDQIILAYIKTITPVSQLSLEMR